MPSTSSPANHDAETEQPLSEEGAASLEALSSGPELDSAPVRRHLEPGTKEDHAQAEAVAMRAATAALHRIASGASMKGMVRMGSSNALQALGLEEEAEKAVGAGTGAGGGLVRTSGSGAPKRLSENSMHSDVTPGSSESGGAEMAIHRVPSRSGRIADMVKVASFGNLGALQAVGSLNDLMHAGALAEADENEAEAQEKGLDHPMEKTTPAANNSWADLSLLVISGGGGGGGGGGNSGGD